MCSESAIRNVGVGLHFPGNLALFAGAGYFVIFPNEIHEAFAVVQPFEKVPRPLRAFAVLRSQSCRAQFDGILDNESAVDFESQAPPIPAPRNRKDPSWVL